MSRRRAARRTAVPAPPAGPPAGPPGRPALRRPRLATLGLAALLCGAVLAGYLPALHGGFIWDDSALLTDNPMVKAGDGLYRFWLTTEAYDYWPLTNTTFWLEWRLWGLDPTGYHVTNVVLHAAEALLLWVVLLKLRVGGAYLAALLFALHPVNVESVAWIAQRKNLVAMLFSLLSVLAFLRADDREHASPGLPGAYRRYAPSVALFLLALLGKGSAAMLPLALLLIVWWRRGQVTRRDLFRLVPFAVLAAAMVLVNVWFQTHGEAPIRDAGIVERLLGAGAVVWFYLSKALLPIGLAFVYPQWDVDQGRLVWWLPLAAAGLVSAVLFRWRGTRARPVAFAWGFFCVALLPVMGLTDVYFMTYSLVADHYQHAALVGVVALAAAGWNEWQRRVHGASRTAAFAVAASVVAAFLWLTARQSATYRSEETLYRAALAVNPGSWLLHYNLAVVLKAQGRRQEETTHLAEAVRLRPDHARARANLAFALLDAGRIEEALRHAEQAVRSRPETAEALVSLGVVLGSAGRPAAALPPLERALILRPDSAEVHHNMGLVLARLDRLPEALEHHRQALRLEPDSPGAHAALADALTAAGRHEEAIAVLEESMRLRPGDPMSHVRLGRALIGRGLPNDAVEHYEEALRLQPDGPGAPESRYNLGVLLTAAGRRQEGIAQYREALRLQPGYAEARYNLAVALMDDGRSAEAVAELEEAVRSRPDLLPARLALVESCARSGRLREAVAHARAALPLLPPEARARLERRIRAWQARLPEA